MYELLDVNPKLTTDFFKTIAVSFEKKNWDSLILVAVKETVNKLFPEMPMYQLQNYMNKSFLTIQQHRKHNVHTRDFIDEQEAIEVWHSTYDETTSSYRDIEMLPNAREFFKKQQLQTGMKNSYLFFNTKDTFYGSNLALAKNYRTVLKNLDIECRTLHNTRHTFASMMLNNGIDPMWVSNTLGHENLDITLRVYAHFMPRKEKMVIEFLDKRYKNGTSSL